MQRTAQGAAAIQQSIARIHEASQAPTLSPQDYRTLFDVMAQEIAANGLAGSQTLVNIVKRAESVGIEIRRDDVRFVLDVVSEADPWFDQGASPSLFASPLPQLRRGALPRPGTEPVGRRARPDRGVVRRARRPAAVPRRCRTGRPRAITAAAAGDDRLWSDAGSRRRQAPVPAQDRRSLVEPRRRPPDRVRNSATGTGGDEFPRIIRTRLRG